jgi:hypothetical protein
MELTAAAGAATLCLAFAGDVLPSDIDQSTFAYLSTGVCFMELVYCLIKDHDSVPGRLADFIVDC